MHRRGALLAIPALAGCAAASTPAPQRASLPRGFVDGAGDPLRAAVLEASDAFSRPARLRGNPSAAARAIAAMEFLAVELPGNPTVPGPTGMLQPQLLGARAEWRAALGIPQDAAPQGVIDALFRAQRALEGGDRGAAVAALPSQLFAPGGEGTLQRLGDLPPLPRTAAAAAAAQQALFPPPPASPIRPGRLR